jgi:hypothetical protein
MPCSNYRVNNECDVQHTVGITVQIINVMCNHLWALHYEQNVSEAKSSLCDRRNQNTYWQTCPHACLLILHTTLLNFIMLCSYIYIYIYIIYIHTHTHTHVCVCVRKRLELPNTYTTTVSYSIVSITI